MSLKLSLILVVSALFLGLLVAYKSVLNQNARLKAALDLERANTQNLKVALNTQNAAIKAREVAPPPPQNFTKIERIVVEDASCVAELKGYKELFRELGK